MLKLDKDPGEAQKVGVFDGKSYYIFDYRLGKQLE
jgi:hypothetical protein